MARVMGDGPQFGPSVRKLGRPVLAASIGWAWSRLCVGLGFLVARGLADHVDMPHGGLHLSEGLLTWDAGIYRALAEGWYGSMPSEVARFFPFYPWFGQRIAWIPGVSEGSGLLAISNLCALAAGIVLWKLVVEVRGSDDSGVRAAWMLAVFPSGYILAFGYSEGLVLLLTSLFLLFLARRKWAALALTGFLIALTRPVGILMVVPVLAELAVRPPKSWLRPALALIAPGAGLLAALAWVSRSTGDFWAPVTIQRQLRAGWLDPIRASGRAVYKLLTGELGYVYNVSFLILFALLLWLSVRQRQPASWVAFSAATLIVALSAYNIDSLARYGLVAVPLVVALAEWAVGKRRQVLVVAVGSLGTMALTTAALLGTMIP